MRPAGRRQRIAALLLTPPCSQALDHLSLGPTERFELSHPEAEQLLYITGGDFHVLSKQLTRHQE